MNTVTCIAPVNIAVIKYWGKRDEELILPINDSISASLDIEQLCAKTTIMASPDFEKDRIWLNDREESMDNKRLQNCLREIKKRAKLSPEMEKWKVHICSRNNFPTAAGLASSAAGYACLSATLAKLYKYEGDISTIARIGSGSACRSTLGGFVRWHMGVEASGSDSVARQIAPASHWPEMRILVLVVNDICKKVSSAVGMKRAVESSEFLKFRAEKIVPRRVEEMERAILAKDFEKFAELTMRDSNQFHAVTLDTYPPCYYLNDVSHGIINLVHQYNSAKKGLRVAYTNDAGPNTVLYILQKDVSEFLSIINYFFPPGETPQDGDYIRGEPVSGSSTPSNELVGLMNTRVEKAGLLKYIIHCRIGDGPKSLDDPREHLLDQHGLPVEFFSLKIQQTE